MAQSYLPLINAVRKEIRSGATDQTKHERVIKGIYSLRNLPRRYTIRVRVPAGILTPDQLNSLADLVEQEATNSFLHITTRHGLEFGGVRAHRLRSVLQKINSLGLTTEWTGGNGIRGIVCCPYSGASRESIFDVTPIVERLDDFLRKNPLYQSMPRKIKISFESCQDDHVRTSVSDIGVRARLNPEGERGFEIVAGGGLGAVPKLAKVLEPFTKESDLLRTLEAILSVFNEHGNRSNRSRARLKWLIEEKGWDWFSARVFEARGKIFSVLALGKKSSLQPSFILGNEGLKSEFPSDPIFQRWHKTNVIPSLRPKTVLVKVLSSLGELSPVQIRKVASIASSLQSDLRITIDQNILLRFVPESQLVWLHTQLNSAGLGKCCVDSALDVTRCAGAALCLSGVTNSRAAAAAISARLETIPGLGEATSRVRIRVSGCANSCSHHNEADIGLFGIPKRSHDRIAPHYAFSVGGIKGPGSFVSRVTEFPAVSVPAAVEKAVQYYVANRFPGESFSDFSRRVGLAEWSALLKPLTQIPSPENGPEYYRDLGEGENFRLDVKAGECSA